ncbi:MAG TPA: LPS assembly lipoprotein LptE [Tepidisphaeraceae bacterium]|nr:LPS assembly lipoprotein LptE [Tepidisphaeraceae bacterium]
MHSMKQTQGQVGGRVRLACAAALAILCAGSTGCGYSARQPFPSNVRTVYVEMFQSREFRRGLEFTLTEALQKRILQDTPYKIADKSTADTMISGEVLEVRQNTLGRMYWTGQPRELQATFVIRFEWKDLRNGQVLVSQPRFVQSIDYVPPIGETFDNASDAALDNLAERIVEQMMSSW